MHFFYKDKDLFWETYFLIDNLLSLFNVSVKWYSCSMHVNRRCPLPMSHGSNFHLFSFSNGVNMFIYEMEEVLPRLKFVTLFFESKCNWYSTFVSFSF